jgi:F-type H+-transporting ATPase subunit b
LNRCGSLAFALLASTAGGPSTASAAEGLNLFPDPIQVAVNVAVFLLLIYPTTRFLLRPLVRVLEERERRTAGALDRVEAMLGEAAHLRQTLETRLDEARERAGAQRTARLQQTESEERQILTEARDGAAQTLEAARTSIASEVAAAREELRSEADALAREIASRVVGRRV